MARPKKDGLDYFPFDVGFFENKKIRALKGKYGSDGVLAYIYTLCQVYKEGYCIELDKDFLLCMADDLNITENSARQIMEYLFSRSLLCKIKDSILTNPVTIITAKSIQRRFQEAKKGAKRNFFVKAKYWLLEKAETLSFIESYPDENNSTKNHSKSEKNSNKSEIYSTKESKGKESKDTYLLTGKSESEQFSTVSTTPTFKEVAACIEEIGGGVNAQKFYNYYSSRGWKDKNGVPIDLKTSVIHWQNTEGKFKSKPKSKSESIPESPMADAYRELIYNIQE